MTSISKSKLFRKSFYAFKLTGSACLKYSLSNLKTLLIKLDRSVLKLKLKLGLSQHLQNQSSCNRLWICKTKRIGIKSICMDSTTQSSQLRTLWRSTQVKLKMLKKPTKIKSKVQQVKLRFNSKKSACLVPKKRNGLKYYIRNHY